MKSGSKTRKYRKDIEKKLRETMKSAELDRCFQHL